MMGRSTRLATIGDRQEIDDILRHDGPVLVLRHSEDLLVGKSAQLRPLGHGLDIVPASTKLLRNSGRVHLIEQDPQASAACSRAYAACKRSASRRPSSIRSSTSSWKSA